MSKLVPCRKTTRPLSDWIRDLVATVLAWLGYYFFGKEGVFSLLDALSTQVDEIQLRVQDGFKRGIGNVRDAVGTFRSSAASAINTTIDTINTEDQRTGRPRSG